MTTLTRILPVLAFGLILVPSAFAAAPERDLMFGSRGEDVVKLQDFLISENTGAAAQALAGAGSTGNFGKLTRAAVIEFQKAKGIAPAYGHVGIKTRGAMVPQALPAPTFTGEVEAVDTGCFADAICSVTVDGKTVILMTGLRMPPLPPQGKLVGVDSIGDLEGMIGATARVYAATSTETGYDYTLYGNTRYYVEVTPAVPDEGRVIVRGTIGCLPPKDPFLPTIALCAFGLKGTDGNYYQLSDEDMRHDIGSYASDQQVQVSGSFKKDEHGTWKSVGTIEVRSIKEVN